MARRRWRRSSKPASRAAESVRRDRSLIRSADRARRLDGHGSRSSTGDRRAEREVRRAFSPHQGDRSEHSRRRCGRHDRGELAQLELVLVAPHSELRSPADQTRRMITAVETRGVHMLAHPRGRQFGARAVCRRTGTRSSAPQRGPVSPSRSTAIRRDRISTSRWRVAPRRRVPLRARQRRALAAGVAARGVGDRARTVSGNSGGRVINCWPVDFLLEWARGLNG